MQPQQLKTLIESGRYRLEPSLVAKAMLRRRAVRELLMGGGTPLNPTDQSQSAPEAGRQAA